MVAALAVGLAGEGVLAQCSSCPGDGPIKVAIGGLYSGAPTVVACHSAGSNFSVDVSSFDIGTLGGDVLIQVFDCASTPTSNIGVITITGTPPTGLNSVAVLVAGASQA
jgi:hypothetical protein